MSAAMGYSVRSRPACAIATARSGTCSSPSRCRWTPWCSSPSRQRVEVGAGWCRVSDPGAAQRAEQAVARRRSATRDEATPTRLGLAFVVEAVHLTGVLPPACSAISGMVQGDPAADHQHPPVPRDVRQRPFGVEPKFRGVTDECRQRHGGRSGSTARAQRRERGLRQLVDPELGSAVVSIVSCALSVIAQSPPDQQLLT